MAQSEKRESIIGVLIIFLVVAFGFVIMKTAEAKTCEWPPCCSYFWEDDVSSKMSTRPLEFQINGCMNNPDHLEQICCWSGDEEAGMKQCEDLFVILPVKIQGTFVLHVGGAQ